jgi:hypothetical protein
MATFGVSTPSEMARSMAFWQMSTVFQVQRDVDRRVGDDQHLVVGRNVHEEDMTEAAARAQACLASDDLPEQLVGVQAALHQQVGLALAKQLHRLGSRVMTVKRDDDPRAREIDAGFFAVSSIFATGPTSIGVMSPSSAASSAPASAVSSQGWATAVEIGSRPRHLATSCSYFPVPDSRGGASAF